MSPRHTARSPAGFPRRALMVALAIGVITLIVYAGALSGEFVYDDHRLVERNPFLQDLGQLPQAFRQDLSGAGEWGIYRPLPAISFMLDLAMWGARPLPFHVVGLLWHLAAVGALAWLVRELALGFGRSPSEPASARWWLMPAVAALLFALHPLNSETAIWICRRADLMAGASALGALAAFLRWRRTGRSGWLAAVVILTMSALLSKEIGVVVPPLVLLLALLPADRALGVSRGRMVGTALLLCVLLPLYALWRMHLFGSAVGQPVGFVQNWVVGLEGSTRVWTQLALVGHYLRLLILPGVLSADYSWRTLPPVTGPGDPMVWLGVLGIAGTLGIGLWAWRRHPALAFAMGLEALAFLPVSNWIVPIGTSFAERLLYLPAAGFLIAVALTLDSVAVARPSARARGIMVGVGAMVVILLGVRTAVRTSDWQNDDTLFNAVLSHYPDNVVARVYAAIGTGARGDREAARMHYVHALEVHPEYHLARVNLALWYLEVGDATAAAREARWVIARDPGPGAAHLTLARALIVLGDTRGAQGELQRATADPRTRLDALLILAGLHLESGDRAGAARVTESAARIAPGHPEVMALRRRLGARR